MDRSEAISLLSGGKEGIAKWNFRRAVEDFHPPDLRGVDFVGAWLVNANLAYTHLEGANLEGANLQRAVLYRTRLCGATLEKANLEEAHLLETNLSDTNLRGAKFFRTTLAHVDFRRANLEAADFVEAWLIGGYFAGTSLRGAIFGYTYISSVLSDAVGAEEANHVARSRIAMDTILWFEALPEKFLRGCGVSQEEIEYFRSRIRDPIQFYSCFISYSSKDQEFAERLHVDLQANGVRVWFAPHDLPIGARIRPAIDESIRVYDKLLLVLSEHSVSSQWVEQEVETALAREREPEAKTVLFPIRIDDAVLETKSGWPALLKNTRNVGDFTRWKEHDSYRRAFDRLLRDLKAET